jgi:hypothetical protein
MTAPLSDDDMERLVVALAPHMPTKADFDDLRKDVQGIVRAWETASGLVAFIKWATGIGAAITLLWEAIVHGKLPTGH